MCPVLIWPDLVTKPAEAAYRQITVESGWPVGAGSMIEARPLAASCCKRRVSAPLIDIRMLAAEPALARTHLRQCSPASPSTPPCMA